MRNFSLITIIIMAIMTMVSCGNKTQQVPFDNGDSADIANKDSTIYGVCGEATTMHVLQMLTDTGDTLMLDIADAIENGQVMGGLQVGDRLAVIPQKDKEKARFVLNQSALLGNWVMPNPIDGSDEVGIRIKEGGIAESIDQSTITYKTWRLVKGKLEIVMVHEGGSGEDETYLYDLVRLEPDTLVYKSVDETYEYSRQKPREQYGKDIVLEKSALEDFQM